MEHVRGDEPNSDRREFDEVRATYLGGRSVEELTDEVFARSQEIDAGTREPGPGLEESDPDSALDELFDDLTSTDRPPPG